LQSLTVVVDRLQFRIYDIKIRGTASAFHGNLDGERIYA